MSSTVDLNKVSIDESKLFLVKALVLVALLASFLISLPLWHTIRDYPVFPLFDSFVISSTPFDICYFVLFAGAWMGAIRTRGANALWFFLAVFVSGLLVDQARWTPYHLQYVLFFLVIAIELSTRSKRFDLAASGLRLVLVCTYVWAGVHKLNLHYFQYTFSWFISPLVERFSFLDIKWFVFLGVFSPFIEIVFGLGLFFKVSRKFSALILILMHVGILVCLGPLGHNYGAVVWPWNMLMIALLWVLSRGEVERDIVSLKRVSHVLVLFIIGFLPSLSLLNRWDSNLSMHMYSGNTASMEMFVKKDSVANWPKNLAPFLKPIKGNESEVLFDHWMWSLSAIGNIPPIELRTYRKIAEYVCERTHVGESLRYVMREKKGFTSLAVDSDREYTGTCAEFGEVP